MQKKVVRFGPFEFEPDTASLRKFGTRVSVQPQPARILQVLIERKGELVSRTELRDELWSPNVFVDYDHSINRSVNRLRQVLSDTADHPRYIETVPSRGYRFLAEVEVVAPAHESAVKLEMVTESVEPEIRRSIPARHWGIVGIAALLLVLIAGFAFVVRQREPNARSAIRVIAVLPVTDLTGDPDLKYVADGLTEAVIAELSRQDGSIAVISSTALAPYKGSSKSPRKIGQELGADYLLESSLEKSGTRLRLTAKLIDSKTQTGIWSQTFDRVEMDRLDFERDIAVALAEQTSIGFSLPSLKPHLENADARRDYQLGLYLRDTRVPEDWGLAAARLQDAIRKDERYPEAYEALSSVYWASPAFPGYDLTKAEAYARKALELDPNSPEAHAQLGGIFGRRGQWKAALDELGVAARLQPNSVTQHYVLATTLRESGHPREAIREYDRILSIAPTHSNAFANAAMAYADVGNFDYAFKLIDRALELQPNSVVALGNKALLFLYRGDFAHALETFDKAFDVGHENTYRATRGFCLGRMGRTKEAEVLAAWFEQRPKNELFHANHLLLIYSGLGRADKAVEQLSAMMEQPGNMEWLDTPDGKLYVSPISNSAEYIEFRRKLALRAQQTDSAIAEN
jgi:TolB-like protein/DNA-binding winged helix-turn-helix (wHTH) protein/Tfp pilus assembly protein PilF